MTSYSAVGTPQEQHSSSGAPKPRTCPAGRPISLAEAIFVPWNAWSERSRAGGLPAPNGLLPRDRAGAPGTGGIDRLDLIKASRRKARRVGIAIAEDALQPVDETLQKTRHPGRTG